MLTEKNEDSLCVLLDENDRIIYIFYLCKLDESWTRQRVLPVIWESGNGYDFYYGAPVKINLGLENARPAFMSDLMHTFEYWRVVEGIVSLYTLDLVVGNLLSHLYGLVPSEIAVETFLQAWAMYKKAVGI